MAKCLLHVNLLLFAFLFAGCATPDPIIPAQSAPLTSADSGETGEWESIAVPVSKPVDTPAVRASPPEPVLKAEPFELTGNRTHVIAEGDTLMQLARKYYSDASKWRVIHEANLGKIENPNALYVGQELVIP